MNLIVGIFGKILELFYRWTGDYGLAIVGLTLLVKLCIVPFRAGLQKSSDKESAQAGRCLLLFLSLPIMVGLYQAVRSGITARTGTCMFPWILSLLERDPLGVLPMLAVLVQLVPQLYPYIRFFRALELTRPKSGMILSSIALTLVICLPLPAGVAIYYLTSGLFSAVEQTVWYIFRLRELERQQITG